MPNQPYNYRMWPDAPQAMHEWLRKVNQTAFGTVTLDADASTTVTSAHCSASSFVLIMPTNAAAATLQAGATHLYITPAAGSFILATANAGNAAGTETFRWAILS
jgi:hypothetical protein